MKITKEDTGRQVKTREGIVGEIVGFQVGNGNNTVGVNIRGISTYWTGEDGRCERTYPVIESPMDIVAFIDRVEPKPAAPADPIKFEDLRIGQALWLGQRECVVIGLVLNPDKSQKIRIHKEVGDNYWYDLVEVQTSFSLTKPKAKVEKVAVFTVAIKENGRIFKGDTDEDTVSWAEMRGLTTACATVTYEVEE